MANPNLDLAPTGFSSQPWGTTNPGSESAALSRLARSPKLSAQAAKKVALVKLAAAIAAAQASGGSQKFLP